MLKEFKKFAMRGNVMDMAVGIIIGAAFGLIIKSLVDHIIMPPIGLLLGQVDFSNLAFTLRAASEGREAVVISYGMFLNTIINFLIVAFAILLVIRQMNKMKKDEPEAEPTTKKCGFCVTEIAIEATRCPNCTSELPAEA